MIKCLRVSLNIMGYELLRSWRRVLDRLVRWSKSLQGVLRTAIVPGHFLSLVITPTYTRLAFTHGVGYWIGWSAGRSHCRVCYGQLLFLGISFLSSSRQHTQGLPSQGPTLTCHHGYTLFIKATLLILRRPLSLLL